MFKEDEAGDTRINIERTKDVLESGATIVASNCPFCLTMLNDGIKNNEKENEIQALDIAEMIAKSIA
jgi:Fe-S oxidoreductase